MRLIEALSKNQDVSIFAVLDSGLDDIAEWDIEPMDGEILVDTDIYYYFVVKAKNVLPDGVVRDCYIDISLPERISDYAICVGDGRLDARYHHEFDGEIVSAVPIDCFGIYDLFYSRISPEVGINVLRNGLKVVPRNTNIAEDLGYILRDEKRYAEAAEMFQLAVDEGPSSYFLYGELAACYKSIGQHDKAQRYQEMFEHAEMSKKRGILWKAYKWLCTKREA